jgi:hypothetical protein
MMETVRTSETSVNFYRPHGAKFQKTVIFVFFILCCTSLDKRCSFNRENNLICKRIDILTSIIEHLSWEADSYLAGTLSFFAVVARARHRLTFTNPFSSAWAKLFPHLLQGGLFIFMPFNKWTVQKLCLSLFKYKTACITFIILLMVMMIKNEIVILCLFFKYLSFEMRILLFILALLFTL